MMAIISASQRRMSHRQQQSTSRLPSLRQCINIALVLIILLVFSLGLQQQQKAGHDKEPLMKGRFRSCPIPFHLLFFPR